MIQQTKTEGGVHVEFQQLPLTYQQAIDPLLDKLDTHRGALFASSFEYPGRYTCWDIGFYNPPLALIVKNQQASLVAFNARGEALLAMLQFSLQSIESLTLVPQDERRCLIIIKESTEVFSEEERSHQPSVFTIIRSIIAFFKSAEEPYLGLYGALGYDLIFQFESMQHHKERPENQRDMVLYFPDEIYIVNHRKEEAFIRRYDFNFQGKSTQGLKRDGSFQEYHPALHPEQDADHAPGEYATIVDKAKKRFACGDLFEVVPSQTFYSHCAEKPSVMFSRMRTVNPSPYGFFINLGEEEYLVGASPEMYVRVSGKLVETCPISGTIKRGVDAIEDAENIRLLLNSAKEESELTMCTDVDRNDKSRICEAGSVQVIGRRQIEMYSRLIHTVDHVTAKLREGFDAVDAFLTHMWVVTVTGAPKLWAMNFIETHEKSPRRWYAGAVGWFGFNGNLNTGLVLRTMRIEKGIAEVRVGATLLYDSDPHAEEQETHLKAAAFLDLLRNPNKAAKTLEPEKRSGENKKILLVDHQDSFVHTLSNYFRQTGATVKTMRFDKAIACLQAEDFDLVVLSPGPGQPKDFQLSNIIDAVLNKKIPLFGVCLGLQGMVEYFGGSLKILNYPMHGKVSKILIENRSPLFNGFSPSFVAGRYHSLYANESDFPDSLLVTARSEDGVIMAISHKTLPVHAVQFHPETILSLPQQAGLRIINNLMDMVVKKDAH